MCFELNIYINDIFFVAHVQIMKYEWPTFDCNTACMIKTVCNPQFIVKSFKYPLKSQYAVKCILSHWQHNYFRNIYIQINTWAFPYWPGYHPETQLRANMGRGMITRPIWKCPYIKLFITYFQHLEKRHPYWPETKSRPILARGNMGLDMEMIL